MKTAMAELERDTLLTEHDPRWKAVVARDASADGTFYYSVATTGVYCRPSCAARLANPRNVRLHATREDAERAGFRPCKRCKPHTARRERLDEIRFAIGNSSIGLVLVAQGAEGLSAVLLGDDREELHTELANRFPGATLIDGDATLQALVAKVVAFVEAPARGLTVFLDMRGSEFQQSVWRALLEIPPGTTTTYRDVANKIGRPNAVRAVAAACAANHLAVVVPCHRVVRTDGQLAGYRWGIERKRALLEREAEA